MKNKTHTVKKEFKSSAKQSSSVHKKSSGRGRPKQKNKRLSRKDYLVHKYGEQYYNKMSEKERTETYNNEYALPLGFKSAKSKGRAKGSTNKKSKTKNLNSKEMWRLAISSKPIPSTSQKSISRD